MQLKLTDPKQAFQFSTSLPPGYQGPVLTDAQILSATNTNGTVVQQEVANSHYIIRHNSFYFLEAFRLKAFQTGARLVAFLALKNNFHYTIEGVGTIKLRPGQFAFLHTSGKPATAEFSKGKQHECLEISWSDEWLRPLADKFEFLQPLFVSPESNQSFILHPKPRQAGVMALDLVQDILKTTSEAGASRLLFETRTKEYLILLLIEAARKQDPASSFTAKEKDTLLLIGDMIRKTFKQKFTIRDLSRQAGMSPTRFKDGFKELHGSPPGEWQMDAKMQKAKQLLLEGWQPKNVALEIGYAGPSNFSNKFHDYFGYWPTEIMPNRSK